MDIPFMNDPTAENLSGDNESGANRAKCDSEGYTSGVGILSKERHYSMNKYYTSYTWSLELSEKVTSKLGWKSLSISKSYTVFCHVSFLSNRISILIIIVYSVTRR